MSEVTDEERRGIAERLRACDGTKPALKRAVFGGGYHTARELAGRLADLIEPGAPGRPEATATEARHGCDIDALLALADEMEKHACGSDVVVAGMSFIHVNRLDEYADRIREACGEEAA